MTTPTLRRVTLATLDNYRAAATQAVLAYRLGSHRLLDVVNGALKNSVYPRTAKLAPVATERLDDLRGNVTQIVVKGIERIAERTEKVIERSSSTAAAQLAKMAEFAAGIDNEIVANGLQAAARLTMPGAKVALVVSGKLAEGVNTLADAAGARPVRKAARRVTAVSKRRAAPVARESKATVKTAARRVAKVAKKAAAV